MWPLLLLRWWNQKQSWRSHETTSKQESELMWHRYTLWTPLFWASAEGPHSPSPALACFHLPAQPYFVWSSRSANPSFCVPPVFTPSGMEQDTRCDLERSSDRKPPVKKPRLPPKRNKSLDFPGTVLFCCMFILKALVSLVYMESSSVICKGVKINFKKIMLKWKHFTPLLEVLKKVENGCMEYMALWKILFFFLNVPSL